MPENRKLKINEVAKTHATSVRDETPSRSPTGVKLPGILEETMIRKRKSKPHMV